MTISDLVMTISDLKHKIKKASFIVASTQVYDFDERTNVSECNGELAPKGIDDR